MVRLDMAYFSFTDRYFKNEPIRRLSADQDGVQ
jgi:hypothetical protein